MSDTAEHRRLKEDHERALNWKRWGPYLSERQWGTVREDYSRDGDPWAYFPFDHARSRTYRFGEDGLLGFTDRQCRLCFSLALWNERDPILKERLFGLSGPEGNHGEDVKECYWYEDSTPTHSYFSSLYRYPHAAFPYDRLREENARRGFDEREFELTDTGVFDEGRFFDVRAEYAKGGPDEILIRITVRNEGAEAAAIHVLPTLWFRNTWSWGRTGEGHAPRPEMFTDGENRIRAVHSSLGAFALNAGGEPKGPFFTENETNRRRVYGSLNTMPYVKDAMHGVVVEGDLAAVNPSGRGTKAALWYRLDLGPGESAEIRLALTPGEKAEPDLGDAFSTVFADRIREAEEFFAATTPAGLGAEEALIVRRARAGLLFSKQFYHYVVREWLEGDPTEPAPPEERRTGRNHDWPHLHNYDVILMPDKWEYPWYAAWDLAFHVIPLCRIDPEFAKEQLLLLTREWYMHPNGALPAYEYELSNANPPVHAWAAWRVYKMTAPAGQRDRTFLARIFQKLLLNFTWWVNRKDVTGNHIFSGGFLGLDNIGVFDRSEPLPTGGTLEQADGTAWMGFYCGTMLSIALELASEDPAYEDVASKFFEHFVAIVDAMNSLGGTGLWDEEDGFYYDQIAVAGNTWPLRIRSLVGLIPLLAAEILEPERIRKLPGVMKRMLWMLRHRPDLTAWISYLDARAGADHRHRLLAIPSRERLLRVLGYLLDEDEFLSPYGLRSLAKVHREHPFVLHAAGGEHRVAYVPGEADSGLFGGNSNWRGPIWFPANFLLVEALERYHHFYGESLKVECPKGSGREMDLGEVAAELERRLTRLFVPDADGHQPSAGLPEPLASDPRWTREPLFFEYFHGDDGRGLGAGHQTGWTALVASLIEKAASAPPATWPRP